MLKNQPKPMWRGIIFEGPDGGGKTTALKTVNHYFPILQRGLRFSSSLKGPVPNLGQAVMNDFHTFDPHVFPKLYDRHPLFSEYIYGPTCRGGVDPTLKVIPPPVSDAIRHQSLVIMCLPPLDVVRTNVSDERDMSHVVANIDDIHALYARLSASDNVITYDYTRDDIENLYAAVRNYLFKE